MDDVDQSKLVDALMADPGLRAEFLQNPVEAAESAGFQLSDEDREALKRQSGDSTSDTELLERLSKRGSAIPMYG